VTFRWLARIGFVLCAIAASALALTPNLTLPEPRALTGSMDLVNHAAAFFVLGMLGMLGWARTGLVLLALLIGAGVLELAQDAIPGRTATGSDFVAGATGLGFAAACIGTARLGRRRVQRETRVRTRR
jgi:VanZ family protein